MSTRSEARTGCETTTERTCRGYVCVAVQISLRPQNLPDRIQDELRRITLIQLLSVILALGLIVPGCTILAIGLELVLLAASAQGVNCAKKPESDASDHRARQGNV